MKNVSMTSIFLMDEPEKEELNDLPEMICLKYQCTKPFQVEESRSFKAESITPVTRNMPSVAPHYHFAADSLAKLSNNKLAVCIGTALISGLEHHCP